MDKIIAVTGITICGGLASFLLTRKEDFVIKSITTITGAGAAGYSSVRHPYLTMMIISGLTTVEYLKK